MSRELDKPRRALTPREEALPANPLQPLEPLRRQGGFFTFRYSSTEVYSQGGQLHVKMRQTRYQDGRLQSEECEGTVDRQAYERMVGDAQAYFFGQMAGVARLLLAPFAPRGRRDD